MSKALFSQRRARIDDDDDADDDDDDDDDEFHCLVKAVNLFRFIYRCVKNRGTRKGKEYLYHAACLELGQITFPLFHVLNNNFCVVVRREAIWNNVVWKPWITHRCPRSH